MPRWHETASRPSVLDRRPPTAAAPRAPTRAERRGRRPHQARPPR